MKLSARLAEIARLVRPGSVLCDVGTDHAYIPVALALNGAITRAVASDINDGPVARAYANVCSNGLSDKIVVVKTNGLHGLEHYKPDDIIIAGMGGELIRDIIDASPIPENSDVRLILQPMTMQPLLRSYLDSSGYCIFHESLVNDGKIYNIICASYSPDSREKPYTDLECLTGRRLIESRPPLFVQYIERLLHVNEAKIAGMERAGLDVPELRATSLQLKAFLK